LIQLRARHVWTWQCNHEDLTESHAIQIQPATFHTVFDNRPDLHNTLDLIIITHNHIDHTRALRAVVEQFSVLRYIDNGQLTGTGTANPNWVRANAQTGGPKCCHKANR
jgi:phosphoribosyl 1,2-cyclic phosphodiesterase